MTKKKTTKKAVPNMVMYTYTLGMPKLDEYITDFVGDDYGEVNFSSDLKSIEEIATEALYEMGEGPIYIWELRPVLVGKLMQETKIVPVGEDDE